MACNKFDCVPCQQVRFYLLSTARHYSYRGMGTHLARSIWPNFSLFLSLSLSLSLSLVKYPFITNSPSFCPFKFLSLALFSFPVLCFKQQIKIFILASAPLHTQDTQRLVWVPWCDSRNRASQYQIEAASWQRRADRMRAE